MMLRSRLSAFLSVPVLAAALLLAAPREASAQCFGPDGLSGPCCAPAQALLPQFPQAGLPALGACWDRCTQGLQRPLIVNWTPPALVTCSEYSSQLMVLDQVTGLPTMSGKMVLDYTRTWLETDPIGNPMQVWRFTVKADLSIPAGGLPVNCATPSCLPAHPTAFFYGYMDYARCTAAGGFQNVLVLNHAPDRFIHAPGLSDRPGVFHPGQSYAIIAPHSPAQPFIPGNSIASGGPLLAEATRNIISGTPTGPCMMEDRIATGQMLKLGAGCLAAISNVPKQYTLRQLNGKTGCVNAIGVQGSFQTLNLNFPTLPWFHLVTASIGTWSNPLVYPGKEECWVDEGLFVRQDACSGDFFEMKYGGTTRGGWNAVVLGGIPTPHFTDLVDNYTAPLSGPFPLPILGSIRPSEHLIYVNQP